MTYLKCGCANAEVHGDMLKAVEQAKGKHAMSAELFDDPLSVGQAVYEGHLIIDDKGILRKRP